jgi:predicted glycosyltransferase
MKKIWFDITNTPHVHFQLALDRGLKQRKDAYTFFIKQGIKKEKLHQYNGYKEDIYIADYRPDQRFLSELPFDNYVLVRPENIQANYIRNGNVHSIASELLKLLTGKGYNVLYLPRYAFDREYANGLKNVHIPSAPVNGLDACYFTDAVLTGAGTFARKPPV